MSQPEQKVCPKCGALAALPAAYCQNCGHQYRTAFTPSAGPPAAFAAPPAAVVRVNRYRPLLVGLGLIVTLALIIAAWFLGNGFNYVAQIYAAREAYANVLTPISASNGGDSNWQHWRQTAIAFKGRADTLGPNLSTITFSTQYQGRNVRIGVATIQQVGPWQWRPVRYVPDLPPYPTLAE